nr:50S ribosomal protein L10 [Anaerococcus nagyae]
MLTHLWGFFIPTIKPLGGEKVSEKAIAAKQVVVDEIKEKIENSKSVTLVGFDRMDVQEITELRTKFREGNSEYKVYKNTMMRFAFEELGYSDLIDELKGSNALIFSNEDSVTGPKVAVDYTKEGDEEKEKLLIKAGLVEGMVQSGDQMVAIASLPNKETLYSMLANVLQSPIQSLAGDLNNTVAKIALALDAVRAKREENGEVAEETPVAE